MYEPIRDVWGVFRGVRAPAKVQQGLIFITHGNIGGPLQANELVPHAGHNDRAGGRKEQSKKVMWAVHVWPLKKKGRERMCGPPHLHPLSYPSLFPWKREHEWGTTIHFHILSLPSIFPWKREDAIYIHILSLTLAFCLEERGCGMSTYSLYFPLLRSRERMWLDVYAYILSLHPLLLSFTAR